MHKSINRQYETFMKQVSSSLVIWGVILSLGIFSILGVYSSVGSLAYRCMGGDTEYYLLKHTILVLMSIVSIYVVKNVDYKYFGNLAKLGMVISIPMLIFTWRYGVKLNEASRWLMLPLLGRSFQPSDLAQISLVVYLSSFYSKNQHQISSNEKVLIPSFRWIISICGLIALANASGAIYLLMVCFIIMFISRVPLRSLFMMGGGIIACCSMFIFVGQRSSTVKNRIENFLSGERSFQSKHSQIAIVNGGITGKGAGKSDQRNILPHPYSDFIYAILVEEYGFIGGIFIIILYLILLYSVIRVFSVSRSIQKQLISVGVVVSIIMQAFLNISVSVGLVPVTGLTLPFISMGGNSLIFSRISLGIILSCLRNEEGIHKN